MRFSVITPSFRNSTWLKLCLPSVADQGVDVEHIIQDAGSDDGTLDWLPHDPRAKVFVEKDSGMYDAIDRGLRRAQGDILSYLNCDEQYLPGALTAVEKYFCKHPDVEIVFGDFVVVDESGKYRFHRRVQTPQLAHTWVCHLHAFSCGMFFRRSMIDKRKLFFDPQLRNVGDAKWVVEALQQGVQVGVLQQFTSVFAFTGENISDTPRCRQEMREQFLSAPLWMRTLRPYFVSQHRLRRWFGGMYSRAPFSYSIYTRESPSQRILHQVSHPSGVWRA